MATRTRTIDTNRTIEGKCHCGSTSLERSDHCSCCGCEEHESECNHICNGTDCCIDHETTEEASA